MPDNENEKQDKTVNKGYGHALFGRKVIYTDETEITAKMLLMLSLTLILRIYRIVMI